MPGRGPYVKGVAKREEILRVALEVIGRFGYSGATVKQVADGVGLSQSGLLHYFGSKDELFVEVLRRRDARDADRVQGGTQPSSVRAALMEIVRHNAEVPGLVQLYVRLSTEATEEGHPAHRYFRERSAAVRAEWTEALRRAQATGDLQDAHDPGKLAVMAMAVIDGLQYQWLQDPDLDMAGVLDHWFALLDGDVGGTREA